MISQIENSTQFRKSKINNLLRLTSQNVKRCFILYILFYISIEKSNAQCDTVSNVNVTNISVNSAQINWNPTSTAVYYLVRYRLVNIFGNPSPWISDTVILNSNYVIPNILSACSEYEVQVLSNCGGISSVFSSPIFFNTLSNFVPNPSSIPVLTFTNATFCQGGSNAINISGSLNGANGWYFHTNLDTTNHSIVGNQLNFQLQDTITYYIFGIESDCYTTYLGPKDSIKVNVLPLLSSLTNDTICVSQVPYNWNGQIINTGGIYTYLTNNVFGCDSIDSLHLTINNLPLSNIIPYSDSTICVGTAIVLYADTNYSNYNWTLNGNVVSATDSVIINSNGSYLLTCIDSNNCSLTDSISITLNPSPQPIILQNNDILNCTNVSANNYQWMLNNIGMGSNTDTLSISQNGTYVVITTDTFGCIGLDSLTVTALALNNYSNNLSINIYPNPTNNNLTIEYELKNTSVVTIKLVDFTGKIINYITSHENQSIGIHKKVVHFKSLQIEDGIYMIQFSDGITNWNKQVIFAN